MNGNCTECGASNKLPMVKIDSDNCMDENQYEIECLNCGAAYYVTYSVTAKSECAYNNHNWQPLSKHKAEPVPSCERECTKCGQHARQIIQGE